MIPLEHCQKWKIPRSEQTRFGISSAEEYRESHTVLLGNEQGYRLELCFPGFALLLALGFCSGLLPELGKVIPRRCSTQHLLWPWLLMFLVLPAL